MSYFVIHGIHIGNENTWINEIIAVCSSTDKILLNPFSPSGHCIGQPSKISILA